jgi:hypothetical protein
MSNKRKREEEEDSSDDDIELENDDVPKTSRVSKEQLEIMEQKLAANPQLYEEHLQFIQALRNSSEFEMLRKARETFSQHFPLSQEQWLLWLQDEESMATTDEEIQKVKALYERSFQDYQLPKVWEQYCDFAIRHFDKDATESVLERAVSTAGAHMLDGYTLWTLYLNYEQKLNDSDKVRSLYRRQLAIPSLMLTTAWEDYQKFETNSAEAEKTAPIFQEASKKLEERMEIEEQLIDALATKKDAIPIWEKYFDVVTKQDPQDIAVQLFERAAQEQCLSDAIWKRYIRYLQEQGAPSQTVMTVYNNASRNCQWNSVLWCGLLEYMELCLCESEWIERTFQRALASMQPVVTDYTSVFLTHCSYLTRAKKGDKEVIRTAFSTAFEYLTQYFKEGDRQCSVERLWAHTEAYHFNDLERAREIYQNILSRFPSEPLLWFNYIQFERDNKATVDQIRAIYRQAVNGLELARSRKSLAVAWAQFERENSSTVNYIIEAEAIVRKSSEEADQELQARRGPKKEFGKREKKDTKKEKKKERKKNAKVQALPQEDTEMEEKQEQPPVEPPPKQQPAAKEPKPKRQPKPKQERKKKERRVEEVHEHVEQTAEAPQAEVKQPPAKKRALMKPRTMLPSGQPLSNTDFKKLFEK